MRRAGKTGMRIPVHVKGNKRSTRALVARYNIDVWDERKMIRDSAKAYYKKSAFHQSLIQYGNDPPQTV
jgi:hypothetical protein